MPKEAGDASLDLSVEVLAAVSVAGVKDLQMPRYARVRAPVGVDGRGIMFAQPKRLREPRNEGRAGGTTEVQEEYSALVAQRRSPQAADLVLGGDVAAAGRLRRVRLLGRGRARLHRELALEARAQRRGAHRADTQLQRERAAGILDLVEVGRREPPPPGIQVCSTASLLVFPVIETLELVVVDPHAACGEPAGHGVAGLSREAEALRGGDGRGRFPLEMLEVLARALERILRVAYLGAPRRRAVDVVAVERPAGAVAHVSIPERVVAPVAGPHHRPGEEHLALAEAGA